MLNGQINSEDDAIVEITLILKDDLSQMDAVVDTGFNGYISIPGKLIDKSDWYRFGEEEYELATGEIVCESIYIGEVIFDGKKRTILIVRSKGTEILIGTKLLSGQLCEFDYKSRIVRIRKGGVLQ
ncbi:MAG: hypothetical protein KKE23_02770 [Nanoarchaeota archaeon]|nr:hypothetical protein [Nanoarchaeota archaeon]